MTATARDARVDSWGEKAITNLLVLPGLSASLSR